MLLCLHIPVSQRRRLEADLENWSLFQLNERNLGSKLRLEKCVAQSCEAEPEGEC